MRQAGRYMADYRALRQKHSFMQLCHEPDLATEITLQPIEAFGMDAAIYFCDILVTAEALGCQLDIVEKVGPVISNPVRTLEDVKKLKSTEDALESCSTPTKPSAKSALRCPKTKAYWALPELP